MMKKMVKKIPFLFVAVILLAITIVSASDSRNYSDLGNITSDLFVYSCWPSCTAYINLTIDPTSPFAGDNLTVSLNNSATASANFAIYWKNETDNWALQGNNASFINSSNLNLTGTLQFMINITLPSALSTKWNVSFNVNGTDYVLDPYLDSINMNSPANYNITDDQTPAFNFTLFSDSETTQRCTLYAKLNGTEEWSSLGANTSTINGTPTTVTASFITEGNYTWKITCNVTGDSASRWIYINDSTVPTMSAISISASPTTATFTWTTNENANSSVDYGTTLSLGDSETYSGYRTSHSIQLTDLDTSTTYYYNATSCDAYGNCRTSSSSFTTSAYSFYDSGGGSVQTQSKSKSWTKLAAGETGIWNINSKDLGLRQINLTIINESNAVKLSALRVLTLSSSISEKSGEVYRYIKIEAANINGTCKISIMLQVEKTWTQNNSLDKEDISLFKFDNSSSQWKKLATQFSSEDPNYYFFNSETESFSYFAIAGEKSSASLDSTSSSTNQTTPQQDNSSAGNATSTSSEDESSNTGIIIMIIIIAVVAIGVVAFIVYSQLFKKKGK